MGPVSRRQALIAATAAVALAAGLGVAGWGAVADAATADGDMTLGNPKAKVKVTEYASVTCSHCAAFNAEVFPAFKKKYIDTGKVFYTLKEFLTEPPQVAAAGYLLARCAGPKQYFPMVDAIFRSQSQWEGNDLRKIMLKIAADHGINEAKFEACLSDKPSLDALVARVDKAEKVDGVTATPTFVINGKTAKRGVMTLEELDAAIAAAAKT